MEEKLVSPKFLSTEAEGLETIYSNHANFSISTWDFTMEFGMALFGKRRTTAKGAQIPLEIKARIVMSPQHIKVFANKLMEMVQGYEKDFGEISIKPKAVKK